MTAAAAGSNVVGIQQRQGTVTNAVRTLSQEVSKTTLDDWHDSAAEYVRQQVFDKKQFVDDGDLIMGHQIQMLVCANLHIRGVERAKQYWDEKGGKETVRNTFRRKRQAAQQAMKLAFRGTYQSPKVCIVYLAVFNGCIAHPM